MKEFKTYHPIVNLIYFVFIIGFSCFFMHPLCLGVSFVCAFLYSVMLKGKRQIKTNLFIMVPLLVGTGAINPVFNHQGITILSYLPGGNPLTLESIIYGLAAGTMIITVIGWFSCYNEIMTSDKFIYLFGKIIPSLSLVISMTLRFVPRFSAQLKTVVNAGKCIGQDISRGSIVKRAKCGLGILSVMTTWSLENAIETADSMKARGYGYPGRTAFSIYNFDKRDKNTLCIILFLGVYIIFGGIKGAMNFSYFPFVKGAETSLFGISVFAAYMLFCSYPLIIELLEVRKWKQ